MSDLLPPSDASKEQPKTQKAETERLPMRISFKAYRATQQHPLPPDVQQQFTAFIKRQLEHVTTLKPSPGATSVTNEEERIMGASWNNGSGWETFRDALGMNSDPSFKSRHPADAGVLVLSTDASNNIIGFSTALLNEKRPGQPDTQPENDIDVSDTYVGVDPTQEYQGRGIGLRCATLRNMILAREGVRGYDTSLWEGSINMYERSGLDMKKLAQLPGGDGQNRFHVALEQQKLAELAEQVGFDPSQNPLEGPIQQDLK